MNQHHQISIVKINRSDVESESVTAKLAKLSNEWEREEGFWGVESCLDSLRNRLDVVSAYATLGVSPDWAGWYLATKGHEDAELLYVFTAGAHRGKGIAQKLMADLIFTLKHETSAQTLSLEVRPSNTAAIKLYESFGFKILSRRRNYYKNGEDALVYQLSLSK